MLGNSATLLQLMLTGLVLCAAGLDMRWRIIPNWLTLAIVLNFMSDRRTAFQNFAARVPLDTANAVATTLIQTEKYGTPLASALRVLSVEFRHTRMMQAEAKAARLPVLMTIPMMVFLVPPIFVVLVAPAACSMMEHGL